MAESFRQLSRADASVPGAAAGGTGGVDPGAAAGTGGGASSTDRDELPAAGRDDPAPALPGPTESDGGIPVYEPGIIE